MLSQEIKDKVLAALEKGTLLVESASTVDGSVSWKPVSSIVQHNSIKKRILEVETAESSCVVTEDHSLFLLEDGVPKECKACDISVGGRIATILDGKLGDAAVTAVREVAPCEHMYDLSVPGNENFVLAGGILAHNTYSVSGVSLDLEKSSKYQSMKENWENQFKDSLERAKNSIKIVKGLQQPRYGIGISSALGPFSRVGVQSRRNYVSGGAGYWS